MRLAGIDIGTNTLRLLIVETSNQQWKELYSERQVTRLGEGFSQERQLTYPAIHRTAEVLKSFHETIQKFRCHQVAAIATSAVREARNQSDFLARMKVEIPLDIRVISGEEEARLTWLGISRGVAVRTNYRILVDIGGGSTEWILADRQKIIRKWSLPLGVVFLTEAYLLSDPPNPAQIEKLKLRIREVLTEITPIIAEISGNQTPVTWIGTAGTVTTLAAMALELEVYSFEKINGYLLTREKADHLNQILLSRKKEERRGMKGLESGREDLIVAGTAILLEAMATFQFKEIMVSDWGLREGIIIDRIESMTPSG